MPPVSEQHAQHDPLLVVSLAAGDLTGADRDFASSLIATCAECANLHDDLLAIARATAALPTAVRPRDFQLSPEQAARLRPMGWRRLVTAFASPRLAMTRQLGIGLTTLGLAGLLVSVLPTVQIGMGGSAAAPVPANGAPSTTDQRAALGAESAASGAPSAAASAAASASASTDLVPMASTPSASAFASMAAAPSASLVQGSADGQPSTSDGYGVAQSQASPSGDRTTANGDGIAGGNSSQAPVERESLDQSVAGEPGLPLLLVTSAILLAAGIFLLVARRIARGLTGS